MKLFYSRYRRTRVTVNCKRISVTRCCARENFDPYWIWAFVNISLCSVLIIICAGDSDWLEIRLKSRTPSSFTFRQITKKLMRGCEKILSEDSNRIVSNRFILAKSVIPKPSPFRDTRVRQSLEPSSCAIFVSLFPSAVYSGHTKWYLYLPS